MPRLPLSKIELDEDEMIVEGFEGEFEGTRVWVTAVLERTCVYETPGKERKLVSKSRILVERDAVPIRRRRVGAPNTGRGKTRGKPGPKSASERADQDGAGSAETSP